MKIVSNKLSLFILCAMLCSGLVLSFLFTTAYSDTSSKNKSGSAKDAVATRHTPTAQKSDAASAVTTTADTRFLWVGEQKIVTAIALENGRPGQTIPSEQLEDLAVDNDRSVVWVATKKDIIQYDLVGTELYRYPLHHKEHDCNERDKDTDHSVDRNKTQDKHKNGEKDKDTDKDKDKEDKEDKEQYTDVNAIARVRISLDHSDGSLWVGAGRELIKLSFDQTELFKASVLGQITDVSVNPLDGSCWVGKQHAISRYASDGARILDIELEQDLRITALAAEAPSKYLWIGTQKGLIKVDSDGNEFFRTTEPLDIQDLKIDTLNDSLWIVTKKRVYKYSPGGEKLLDLSVCDVGNKEAKTKKAINERAEKKNKDRKKNSDAKQRDNEKCDDKDKDDTDPTCVGNLITLAVDQSDSSCWVASNTVLLKLSDQGEELLRLKGFKQIEALDAGFDQQRGPFLKLCVGHAGDGPPRPPLPGWCAQQMLVNRTVGDLLVSGLVRTTTVSLTLDDVLLPDDIYLENTGAFVSGSRVQDFFWTFVMLPNIDGPHSFTAVATNAAGIKSKATVTFILDTIPPKLSITSPTDNMVTSKDFITISGTVDDPLAIIAIDFYTEIGPNNNAFSSQFSFWGDGYYPIEIAAYDPAGNYAYESRSVFRDTTPPQITISTPAEGLIVNTPTLNIIGAIDDLTPDTVTVAVNAGQPRSLVMAGSDFQGAVELKPGTNTLAFQARDRAGFTGSASRTVVLDQTPPIVAITSPLPNTSLTGTATVSVIANDVLSGIRSVELLVDGNITSTLNQAPYDFQLDTMLLTTGTHTVTARAFDTAGNQGEASMNVMIQPNLNLEITSPGAGATVNKARAIVKGRIIRNNDKETGIVINGMLAQVNGNDFAAIVPLQAGANSITATATNTDGMTASTTITINTDTPEELLRLTVNPTSGIMTKQGTSTSFDTNFEVAAYLPNPIASYAWDTNGDTISEQTGTTLITAKYTTPGLYFPTVKVTDTMGNIYTETTIVNVLDRDKLDAILQAKWAGMKMALVNNDIEGAVGYFHIDSKQLYNDVFSAIGRQLQPLVDKMQAIQLINMQNCLAKYRITKDEMYGDQSMMVTYYIYFIVDGNGIWRIAKF